MDLFVYEHLSGGGLAEPGGAASLRREGWAMLSALLHDLGGCAGVRTASLLDAEALRAAGGRLPANLTVQRVEPGRGEEAFRRLAAAADATLLVAPECDDVLYRRCVWVEEAGGRLLGPSPAAVRLTGDKLLLAGRLEAQGVPTPPTVAWPAAGLAFPLVCKPRDGAGSQATFLVRDEAEAATVGARAAAEGWGGPLIAQPFAPGLAASAAVLLGPGRRVVLPAARQLLSDDGRFRYLGGSVPLPAELDRRARALAERATAAVEGLNGWVGVDLVLGERDVVVEINPRLTTSYVGLRALARFNLAEALLRTAQGGAFAGWDWRSDEVRFEAPSV
jgi:predicted ATP-grasp superfamily ATP-dependent carboligase